MQTIAKPLGLNIPKEPAFSLKNPFWADLLAHRGRRVKITASSGVFIGTLLHVDMQHFNLEIKMDSGCAYFRGDGLLMVELMS